MTTKAQRRRETMARFTQEVEDAKRQLAERGLSVAELIEQFHCGDFPTELAAAQLVYARNRDDVMGDVLAGLNHPEWKVRRMCADFLDHWADHRSVEPLLRALRDPHENVRRLALHSLTCQQCKTCPLEGDFVPPLVEVALTDRSARVRRIATNILAKFMQDARVVDALVRLADNDADAAVVRRAQAALGSAIAV